MVLGALASLAVSRYSFFGRETISFVLILAIALPGVVTGMALSTTFGSLDVPLGFFAIVVGHATFCIVLVYNNAIARLRRIVELVRGGVRGPRRGHASRRSATSPSRPSGRR